MNSSSYKKYTAVLMMITALALIIAAVTTALKRPDPPAAQAYASYYSPNTAASQETEEKPGSTNALRDVPRQANSTQSRGTYLITVYEGKIAAFVLGDDVPFLVGDLPVELLPEADRRILEEGIIVDRLADLKTVLEDYE